MARSVHPVKNSTRRRFGSIAAGAEETDVSTQTIRRMIARGQLPAYRIGPRLMKIDLDELAALLRPIPTAGYRPPAA